MKRFNNIFVGLGIGIILPIVFLWIYLAITNPLHAGVIETIKMLYPSQTLGKLFMLAIIPNLLLVFVFYKLDSFKIGAGLIAGIVLFLIGSILMM